MSASTTCDQCLTVATEKDGEWIRIQKDKPDPPEDRLMLLGRFETWDACSKRCAVELIQKLPSRVEA